MPCTGTRIAFGYYIQSISPHCKPRRVDTHVNSKRGGMVIFAIHRCKNLSWFTDNGHGFESSHMKVMDGIHYHEFQVLHVYLASSTFEFDSQNTMTFAGARTVDAGYPCQRGYVHCTKDKAGRDCETIYLSWEYQCQSVEDYLDWRVCLDPDFPKSLGDI